MTAHKQAKVSPDGTAMIDTAMKVATTIPLGTAQKAREVADLVSALRPITSPNMASDLTVAVALAEAAVQGALANVEINLGSLKDAGFAAEVRSKTEQLRIPMSGG